MSAIGTWNVRNAPSGGTVARRGGLGQRRVEVVDQRRLVEDVAGGGQGAVLDERDHLPEPQRDLDAAVGRVVRVEHRPGEDGELPVEGRRVLLEVVLEAQPQLLALVERRRLGRGVGEVERLGLGLPGLVLGVAPTPRRRRMTRWPRSRSLSA